MKKIYFLFMMAFALGVNAQFTVTSSMNPIIGDIEKTWDLDTTNLPLGSSGTAQIWNYTGITISPTTAVLTNSYVAPSSCPNYTVFPGAVNMAQTSDGSTYAMFGYTSSGITVYGFNTPSITAIYQNPETFVNFPFTYGTISSDTYSTSYSYSTIPVTTMGTITTTGDGTGTLNTPGNSYQNVLRVKIQDKTITSFGSFQTTTTTAVNYIYLSGASKFALLSVNTKTDVTSTSTVVAKTKSGSVNDIVLAGIRENKTGMNFSIYPNPSIDKKVALHFALTNSENYMVTIYNVLGQEVKKVNLGEKAPGIYSENISLEEMKSGVYYIRLKGNKQEGAQKLIID